jgi:hypothetical protein
VRAAAGTGKTWLLTSRLITLLMQGVPPGSILAITFTRKAAAEIHQRVSQRLLAMVVADERELTHQLETLGLKANTNNLRQARSLFEALLCAEHELRATTFHAFCQDILRRFSLEAEVPPGFELLESTAELEHQAWQALEREATIHPGSDVAFFVTAATGGLTPKASATRLLTPRGGYARHWAPTMLLSTMRFLTPSRWSKPSRATASYSPALRQKFPQGWPSYSADAMPTMMAMHCGCWHSRYFSLTREGDDSCG